MELFVLIYCCFLFFLQIAIDVSRKKFSFFDPKHLFQLYFIVQLPLSAYLTANTGNISTDERFQFSIDNGVHTRLLIYICLAQTVFLIGVNTLNRAKVSLPLVLRQPWDIHRVRLFVFIMLIIGYLSFFALIQMNGGFSSFIDGRSAWRSGGMTGQGFIIFPCTTLLGTLAAVYTIADKKRLAASQGRFAYYIFIFLCIFPALFMGFRGFVLLPILQVLVVYNFVVRKIPFALFVKSILIFAVSFTIYGIYREFGLRSINDYAFLIKERPDLIFNVFLRSRGNLIVETVIGVLDQTKDFQNGFQYLIEASTIIIPGMIWNDKPTPLSVDFSNYFFHIGGGVSPTVLGELYWISGLLGIVIGMYFLGILMSIVYNTMLKYPGRDTVMLIYGQLFVTLVMVAEAIAGNLNGIVMYMFFIVPVIIFISSNQKEIIPIAQYS